MSYKYIEADALKGKTITSISRVAVGDCDIDITTDDGKRYRFLHFQDCCESVAIHDIVGDLAALVGKPLTVASKEADSEWPAEVTKPKYCESFTWTTLRLETENAKVRVRWLGESNGYYGEGIDLEELD